MPFFLILCLRSRDNLEPWPLMAFLLPPKEIVYYHYQLQQDRAHDVQRATITVGVTADSALTPTVIVVIVTVIVVAVAP